MKDFDFNNPVRIHFGHTSLSKLPEEIKRYGTKVLLVYGGGSIKKYGHYQAITEELEKSNLSFIDFGGNILPSYAKVLEAIDIVKQEKIDVILGVGGSTVMDMAKIIAFGAKNDNLWAYLSEELPNEACDMLPVGEIPTFPSGGSEVDSAAEIDDYETGEHGALYGRYPSFAILNPAFSYSINPKETAYGALVSFAQASSAYFGGESPIADGLSESVLRQILKDVEVALKDPENYDARANLMWASALTTIGILNRGKEGYWSMYASESLAENLFGIPYRYATAVIFPKWLKAISDHEPNKAVQYMTRVLNVDPEGKDAKQIIEEGVYRIQAVFERFGIASNYKEFKDYIVDEELMRKIETIAEDDDVLSKKEVIDMFVKCL